MKVLDKVSGVIVEVAWITNNGFVYHLINSEGVIYRRFSDEIEQLQEQLQREQMKYKIIINDPLVRDAMEAGG
ncbi:hypothetical protein ACT2B6_13810 [Candidatus Enterococcus leclercqii]